MSMRKTGFFSRVFFKLVKPFIQNVRFGFATNSSSSHSMVYMKKPNESDPRKDPIYVDIYDGFNWNDFRLDTIGEKLIYLAAMDSDLTRARFENEFPELAEREDADAIFEMAKECTVDHQSYDTIGPEEARDPYVVVFGGNDNGDTSWERAQAFDEIDFHKTRPEHDEFEKMDPAFAKSGMWSYSDKMLDDWRKKDLLKQQAEAEKDKNKKKSAKEPEVKRCPKCNKVL